MNYYHCYHCMLSSRKTHSKLTVWVIFWVLCEVIEWPHNEPTVSFNVSSRWVSCELKLFTGLSIFLPLPRITGGKIYLGKVEPNTFSTCCEKKISQIFALQIFTPSTEKACTKKYSFSTINQAASQLLAVIRWQLKSTTLLNFHQQHLSLLLQVKQPSWKNTSL